MLMQITIDHTYKSQRVTTVVQGDIVPTVRRRQP